MASAPRSYGLARAIRTSTLSSRVCSRCLPAVQSPRNVRAFSTTNARMSATFKTPAVVNEPNQHYAKGSVERERLEAAVAAIQEQGPLTIPIKIGRQTIRTTESGIQFNPSDYQSVIAHYSMASAEDVYIAIEAALAAKPAWESTPFADRAAVFLKAADLISTKYRYEIMATTMLGQGKNAWQAEIDAAAELCDFFRFAVKYAEDMYAQQPPLNSPGLWNRIEYRPLEGFVYAVSPFNFTAIGGNLAGLPALLGNVVIWKPSDYAVASGHLIYKILLEAGLPKDVIQFVPGDPEEVTLGVLRHQQFAALHYTGSTAVLRRLFRQIGERVSRSKFIGYPRIIGESGGKNFHLVHHSADIDNAVVHTVRGAFEYSGQKCSATSRLYVASSIWPEFKEKLITETKKLRVGPAWHPDTFVGPVIHPASFVKLTSAIDEANVDQQLERIVGGTYDGSTGHFIDPTIYATLNPEHKLLSTELFGPILTVYVYDDRAPDAFAEACRLVDRTSEYGLTGSVFAQDRKAIRKAEDLLRNAAGNFYINCKSTGAVVGQQPFGGARASGTNDKAGSINIMSRFVSLRSIKEEFSPSTDVLYPSNEV
ncbi:delta 1-pyrroline-5-carboxylate dehydrogenase [Jackrogersella minutella]|nr:delta 1-pyrroline-5-carboxylate dehydrogenase [Jackrogersella minutella]